MAARTVRRATLGFIICICALSRPMGAASHDELVRAVTETEKAFAKSMADRDLGAFRKFLSDEAIFVGPKVLRGEAEIVDGWKGFFDGEQAPFSWTPERVEVVKSGKLALSSGPVFDPSGHRIATFNSVWRREKGGAWKIVLDNACDCGAPGKD